MPGWLLHFLGLDSGSGPAYLFWSGFGANFGEFTIAAAVWHHLTCHEPRCWRLARYPVAGTTWKACRRHHPAPPRRGSIREQHRLYLGKQPGRG